MARLYCKVERFSKNLSNIQILNKKGEAARSTLFQENSISDFFGEELQRAFEAGQCEVLEAMEEISLRGCKFKREEGITPV